LKVTWRPEGHQAFGSLKSVAQFLWPDLSHFDIAIPENPGWVAKILRQPEPETVDDFPNPVLDYI
jgi:hypothetical protein